MDSTSTPAAEPAAAAAVPAVPEEERAKRRREDATIRYIASFKLAKAVLFLAAALGLFRLVHKDTQVEVRKVLHAIRIDGDGAFAKQVLLKANLIDDPKKKISGAILTFCGLLFTVEGVGLFFRKTWAEYLTVILTASAIPFELYELFHRAESKVAHLVPSDQRASFFLANRTTGLKLALLVLNVAILWYLINHLRRSQARRAALLAG